MNIPSEGELDFPSFRPLKEIGFYESRFIPLLNPDVPNVIVYNKDVTESSSLHAAGKGVYVIVDTKNKDSKGRFFVFIGSGGATGEKATLSGNYDSRLNRLWRNAVPGIPKEITEWDKAILIFDWENSIENWLSVKQTGNFADQEKRKLIDAVMDSEVSQFEKFLYHQLEHDAQYMSLNVLNETKPEINLPEIDLPRFEYYADIVKDLLQIITGQ